MSTETFNVPGNVQHLRCVSYAPQSIGGGQNGGENGGQNSGQKKLLINITPATKTLSVHSYHSAWKKGAPPITERPSFQTTNGVMLINVTGREFELHIIGNNAIELDNLSLLGDVAGSIKSPVTKVSKLKILDCAAAHSINNHAPNILELPHALSIGDARNDCINIVIPEQVRDLEYMGRNYEGFLNLNLVNIEVLRISKHMLYHLPPCFAIPKLRRIEV